MSATTIFDLGNATQVRENTKDDGTLIIPVGIKIICNSKGSAESFDEKVKRIWVLKTAKEIREYAFCDCNIPIFLEDNGRHLIKIGRYAFHGANISKIRLGKNLKFLGQYCFSSSEICSVSFAKGFELDYIPNWAFSNTHKLNSLIFPKSIASIRFGAFRGSGLKIVKFKKGNHLRVLGEQCFAITNVECVYFGSKLEVISESAFSCCKNLIFLSFGRAISLRIICYGAFYGTGLKSVSIPPNVELIDACVFSRTTKVIVMPRDEASLLGVVSYSFNGSSTASGCEVLDVSRMRDKKNKIYNEIFGSEVMGDPPLEEPPKPEVMSDPPLEESPESGAMSVPSSESPEPGATDDPPTEEPLEPEAILDSPSETPEDDPPPGEPEPKVILDPPPGEPEPEVIFDSPLEESPEPEATNDSSLETAEKENLLGVIILSCYLNNEKITNFQEKIVKKLLDIDKNLPPEEAKEVCEVLNDVLKKVKQAQSEEEILEIIEKARAKFEKILSNNNKILRIILKILDTLCDIVRYLFRLNTTERFREHNREVEKFYDHDYSQSPTKFFNSLRKKQK